MSFHDVSMKYSLLLKDNSYSWSGHNFTWNNILRQMLGAQLEQKYLGNLKDFDEAFLWSALLFPWCQNSQYSTFEKNGHLAKLETGCKTSLSQVNFHTWNTEGKRHGAQSFVILYCLSEKWIRYSVLQSFLFLNGNENEPLFFSFLFFQSLTSRELRERLSCTLFSRGKFPTMG